MMIVSAVLIIVLCFMAIVCKILYQLLKESNSTLNNTQHMLFVLRKMDKRNEQQNNYLEKRLQSDNYRNIAIYGYSIIGKRIEKELQNTEINVECIIDQNAANLISNRPIYSNVEKIPTVDAIVVTVVSQYYEIKNYLSDKVQCPIISLEELL